MPNNGPDGPSLAHLPKWVPWKRVYGWSPFSIDALGLVTLLGAEEMNRILGRLVPSRYLEFMPLLGAYVVAGDRFKDKDPGYKLYNLTMGIFTTDMSFWFTRWMDAQDFEVIRSKVEWEIVPKSQSRRFFKWTMFSAALGFCLLGFLVAFAVLTFDWYGFANAVAMIVLVLVRVWVMQANRNAIDAQVDKAEKIAKQNGEAPKDKIVVISSDSRMVTMSIPRTLIIPIFSKNVEPKWNRAYHFARWTGWVAFGVHVVCLGMTQLAIQLYVVFLMVVPTVLLNWKFGCDDSKWKVKWERARGDKNYTEPYECWIGTRLKATVSEWPEDHEFVMDDGCYRRWNHATDDALDDRTEKRQHLYAWLNMTRMEEESWGKWDLFPHRRDDEDNSWWETYQNLKLLMAGVDPGKAKEKAREIIEQGSTAEKPGRKRDNKTMIQNEVAERHGEDSSQHDSVDSEPVVGIRRRGTNLEIDGTVHGMPTGGPRNRRASLCMQDEADKGDLR